MVFISPFNIGSSSVAPVFSGTGSFTGANAGTGTTSQPSDQTTKTQPKVPSTTETMTTGGTSAQQSLNAITASTLFSGGKSGPATVPLSSVMGEIATIKGIAAKAAAAGNQLAASQLAQMNYVTPGIKVTGGGETSNVASIGTATPLPTSSLTSSSMENAVLPPPELHPFESGAFAKDASPFGGTPETFSKAAAEAQGFKVIKEPSGAIELLAPGGEIFDIYGKLISSPATRAAEGGEKLTTLESQALNQQTIAATTAPVDYHTFGTNSNLLAGKDGNYVVAITIGNHVFDINTGVPAMAKDAESMDRAKTEAYDILQANYANIVKNAPDGSLINLNANTGTGSVMSHATTGGGGATAGSSSVGGSAGITTLASTAETSATPFNQNAYYAVTQADGTTKVQKVESNDVFNTLLDAGKIVGTYGVIAPAVAQLINQGTGAAIVFGKNPALELHPNTNQIPSSPLQLSPEQEFQIAGMAGELGRAGAELTPTQVFSLLYNLGSSGLTQLESLNFIKGLTPDQLNSLSSGSAYTLYTKTPNGNVSQSYAPTSSSYATYLNAITPLLSNFGTAGTTYSTSQPTDENQFSLSNSYDNLLGNPNLAQQQTTGLQNKYQTQAIQSLKGVKSEGPTLSLSQTSSQSPKLLQAQNNLLNLMNNLYGTSSINLSNPALSSTQTAAELAKYGYPSPIGAGALGLGVGATGLGLGAILATPGAWEILPGGVISLTELGKDMLKSAATTAGAFTGLTGIANILTNKPVTTNLIPSAETGALVGLGTPILGETLGPLIGAIPGVADLTGALSEIPRTISFPMESVGSIAGMNWLNTLTHLGLTPQQATLLGLAAPATGEVAGAATNFLGQAVTPIKELFTEAGGNFASEVGRGIKDIFPERGSFTRVSETGQPTTFNFEYGGNKRTITFPDPRTGELTTLEIDPFTMEVKQSTAAGSTVWHVDPRTGKFYPTTSTGTAIVPYEKAPWNIPTSEYVDFSNPSFPVTMKYDPLTGKYYAGSVGNAYEAPGAQLTLPPGGSIETPPKIGDTRAVRTSPTRISLEEYRDVGGKGTWITTKNVVVGDVSQPIENRGITTPIQNGEVRMIKISPSEIETQVYNAATNTWETTGTRPPLTQSEINAMVNSNIANLPIEAQAPFLMAEENPLDAAIRQLYQQSQNLPLETPVPQLGRVLQRLGNKVVFQPKLGEYFEYKPVLDANSPNGFYWQRVPLTQKAASLPATNEQQATTALQAAIDQLNKIAQNTPMGGYGYDISRLGVQKVFDPKIGEFRIYRPVADFTVPNGYRWQLSGYEKPIVPATAEEQRAAALKSGLENLNALRGGIEYQPLSSRITWIDKSNPMTPKLMWLNPATGEPQTLQSFSAFGQPAAKVITPVNQRIGQKYASLFGLEKGGPGVLVGAPFTTQGALTLYNTPFGTVNPNAYEGLERQIFLNYLNQLWGLTTPRGVGTGANVYTGRTGIGGGFGRIGAGGYTSREGISYTPRGQATVVVPPTTEGVKVGEITKGQAGIAGIGEGYPITSGEAGYENYGPTLSLTGETLNNAMPIIFNLRNPSAVSQVNAQMLGLGNINQQLMGNLQAQPPIEAMAQEQTMAQLFAQPQIQEQIQEQIQNQIQEQQQVQQQIQMQDQLQKQLQQQREEESPTTLNPPNKYLQSPDSQLSVEPNASFQQIYSSSLLPLILPGAEKLAEANYSPLSAIGGLRPVKAPIGAAPLTLNTTATNGTPNTTTTVTSTTPGVENPTLSQSSTASTTSTASTSMPIPINPSTTDMTSNGVTTPTGSMFLSTIPINELMPFLNQVNPRLFSTHNIQFGQRGQLLDAIKNLSKVDAENLLNLLPPEQRAQIYLQMGIPGINSYPNALAYAEKTMFAPAERGFNTGERRKEVMEMPPVERVQMRA